jgi:transposase-like protein
MTMNCPLCGTMMVWLNGSISHDPPVKHYTCRICNVYITKQNDNSYQIDEIRSEQQVHGKK